MSGYVALVAGSVGALIGGALGARILRLRDPLDWLLATLLLACAHVVLVSLAAGAVLGRYEAGAVLAGVALVDLVLASAVARLHPRSARLRDVTAAGRNALASLAAWQWILVGVAAIALLWRALLSALLPPFAYDALTYHLTAVASWIQAGSIGPNPYAPCCERYPANAEILFGWPTLLLGRDTWTDLVQLVLALVGALAVAGLARHAGVSAAGATTASALFLLTPIVLTQANTNYNDVVVVAMLLVALYFMVRFASQSRSDRSGDALRPAVRFALLAGVAAGFALGTKTSGTVIAGVVATLVVGHAVVALFRGRVSRGTAFGACAAFVAGVLAVGAWWYADSWQATGNPVWPFQVSLLGLEIFDGPRSVHEYLTVPPDGDRFWLLQVGRSWYHDLAFWQRGGYSYEERSGGLGPLWSWLGWVAVAVGAAAALRYRREAALDVVVSLALVFVLLPYSWWSRFTMYLAAAAAIALVWLLERLRPSALRAALAAAVVVLALAGAALASWRVDPAGFGRTATAVDVGSLALHPSRSRSLGSVFFSEYRWLDSVPARATIGVELDAPSIRFPYAFFGGRLERTLVVFTGGATASIDERLAGPRPVYLVVEQGGRIDRWARRRPREYTPIFLERGIHVFRRTRAILSS